ncbi:MAG: helix-hairpin-helix domain-containing protein [Candidatus Pacearchaeota archaeon]
MKTGTLYWFIFISVLLVIPLIPAQCGEGEIDVNTASKEKLQEFTGIGPVKSQSIIDYRTNNPFEEVDDLINVNGIGPATLQDMKDEGACVSNNESKEENESVDNEKEPSDEDDYELTQTKHGEVNSEEMDSSGTGKAVQTNTEISEPINLNPKDIKSDEDFSKSGRGYAVYGFIIFSIIIGILFLIQKNRYKNEFR